MIESQLKQITKGGKVMTALAIGAPINQVVGIAMVEEEVFKLVKEEFQEFCTLACRKVLSEMGLPVKEVVDPYKH